MKSRACGGRPGGFAGGMPVTKLLHTRMRVNDLERTLRFYQEALGLTVSRRHTIFLRCLAQRRLDQRPLPAPHQHPIRKRRILEPRQPRKAHRTRPAPLKLIQQRLPPRRRDQHMPSRILFQNV